MPSQLLEKRSHRAKVLPKQFEKYLSRKFVPPEELEAFREQIEKEGLKLATLNGSFDLLHAGHLYTFFEAARVADVTLVALNSDESIRQYKSPDRPIIPLKKRMEMLGALELIDYVTYFHETTPVKILEKLKPHVHLNGAYYGENCVEAEVVKKHGGELHLVEIIPGLSTSEIIKKIQGLCD